MTFFFSFNSSSVSLNMHTFSTIERYKFETLFESYYSSIIFIFLSLERFIEKDIIQCVKLIFKKLHILQKLNDNDLWLWKSFFICLFFLLSFFELFVSKKVLNTPIYTFEKLQARFNTFIWSTRAYFETQFYFYY